MKTKIIRVRIDPPTETRLKTVAVLEGKSLSEVIRALIVQSLDSEVPGPGPEAGPGEVSKAVDILREEIRSAAAKILAASGPMNSLYRDPGRRGENGPPTPAPPDLSPIVRELQSLSGKIEGAAKSGEVAREAARVVDLLRAEIRSKAGGGGNPAGNTVTVLDWIKEIGWGWIAGVIILLVVLVVGVWVVR